MVLFKNIIRSFNRGSSRNSLKNSLLNYFVNMGYCKITKNWNEYLSTSVIHFKYMFSVWSLWRQFLPYLRVVFNGSSIWYVTTRSKFLHQVWRLRSWIFLLDYLDFVFRHTYLLQNDRYLLKLPLVKEWCDKATSATIIKSARIFQINKFKVYFFVLCNCWTLIKINNTIHKINKPSKNASWSNVAIVEHVNRPCLLVPNLFNTTSVLRIEDRHIFANEYIWFHI